MRLRRQWAVASAGVHEALSDRRELSRGLSLFVHPDTSVRSCAVCNEEWIVLGVAARESGGALFDGLANAEDQTIEAWLRDLAGVYAVVRDAPSGIRIYTDPAGMMNVFIGERSGVIASTPAVLPESANIEAAPIDRRDDWMLWDRTPFDGVRLLPANHALDVATGEFTRFWPGAEFFSGREEPQANVAQRLRGIAESLASERRVLISLTGGLDSRVSLAAMRGSLDRCEAFTLDCLSTSERKIVEGLAGAAGIPHRWVPVEDACESVLALYDEMTLGLSVGSRRDVAGGCWNLRNVDAVHLSGNLGAIAKAFYWPGASAPTPSSDLLLRDFHVRTPQLRESAQRWLTSLPADLSNETACNLMYLEQRGGRWMGIGEVASNLFYEPMSLFSSRGVFEAVCSAPRELQRGGKLLAGAVAELWPELAELPYASGTSAWRRMLPRRLKSFVEPFAAPLIKGKAV